MPKILISTSVNTASWKPTSKQVEEFLAESKWSKSTAGMLMLWGKISRGESLIEYHRQPGTHIRNMMRIIGIKQNPIELDGTWQTMTRHAVAKIMGKPVPPVVKEATQSTFKDTSKVVVDPKVKAARSKLAASISEAREKIKALEAKLGKPETLKERDLLKAKLTKLLAKKKVS